MDYKKLFIPVISLLIGFGSAYMLHKRCMAPFTCIQPDPVVHPTCDTCGWNVTVIVREITPGGRPGDVRAVSGASVSIDRGEVKTTDGEGRVTFSGADGCPYAVGNMITATLGTRRIEVPMRIKCGAYYLMLP